MRKINIFTALSAVIIIGTCQTCEKMPSTTVDAQYRTPVIMTDRKINGTSIRESSTVAGLITDSSTGRGIEGVPVTDGYSFTKTDRNGVYQMAASDKARKIHYTTPAGYEIALDETNHLPAFFSKGTLSKGKHYRIDFSLKPMDNPGKDFTLLMVGDPQCKVESNVERYKNETIADIIRTAAKYPGEVYAITLGDETFDSYDTWEPVRNAMSNVQSGDGYIPFFNCIGNHDHNSLEEDTDDNATDDYNATGKFISTFGPTDYSFDRGDAHIIVMDNVCVTYKAASGNPNKAGWKYIGGFTDEQYRWLEQDISNVVNAKSKLCIFCCHIPFRSGSKETGTSVSLSRHYEDVLDLLTQFRESHIMIGHTHYQQNYIHKERICKGGQPIYEHIHGAACGAWWTADCSVTGAPAGYSIYSISGANVSDWHLKGSNKRDDYQMRVYDGNQIFNGTKGFEYLWSNASVTYRECTAKGFTEAKDALVAEVFDDDDSFWKLELYVDGLKKGDFTRASASGISNIPLVSYWFNEKNKHSATWCSATASHFWYCKTSVKPSELRDWEVRATFTVPTNPSVSHTYSCTHLTTDYSEFDK